MTSLMPMPKQQSRRVLTQQTVVRAVFTVVAVTIGATVWSADALRVPDEVLAGLAVRPLGPAAVGGRIAEIAAVGGENRAIWVGSDGGGIWKSTDDGLTFQSVFDGHHWAIASLTIDPLRPESLWVGTGEGPTPAEVTSRQGIYRTVDGGATWLYLGLSGTGAIARVGLDPSRIDTAYACATGHPFGDSGGVYRTEDAGRTWQRVLRIDASTGCSDLAVDPSDGRTVYVSMWRLRSPALVPNLLRGGLFKSIDGGTTWRRLTQGLPAEAGVRFALTVSPVRHNVLFAAAVDADGTAVYRSDDSGETWERSGMVARALVNARGRPRLVPSPREWERLWVVDSGLAVSSDAGRTFAASNLGTAVHPDVRALWLDPGDGSARLLGTSGGLYLSANGSRRWRRAGTLPLARVLHVSLDQEKPFGVLAAVEDSGAWQVPSRQPGGVASRHWRGLMGGSGAFVWADPWEPTLAFADEGEGRLFRIDRSTLERRDIRPTEQEGDPPLRFGPRSPLALSPTVPGTLYCGAQAIYRSRNRGDTWERLSPDLTASSLVAAMQRGRRPSKDEASAGREAPTISALAESPRNQDLVWAGTENGNLYYTWDGGTNWHNVAPAIAGLPARSTVSSIELSRFDEATLYVTFDARRQGETTALAYRSADSGRTWTSLRNADLRGAASVLREDPTSPEVLYAGTEAGLFVSLDAGRTWTAFAGGLPRCPVLDLALHPRDPALVIATAGRGLFVVDDLTPLRRLTTAALAAEVAFVDAQPVGADGPPPLSVFFGDGEFVAPSPPSGAAIVYLLRTAHADRDVKLEVFDASGRLVSVLPATGRRGLNCVYWPARMPQPLVSAGGRSALGVPDLVGPRVADGSYTARLTIGSSTYTGRVPVASADGHPAPERKMQQDATRQLYFLLERLTFLADSLSDTRDQCGARALALPQEDGLKKRLAALADRMGEQREALIAPPGTADSARLQGEITALYRVVSGYGGRPSAAQVLRIGSLSRALDAAMGLYETTLDKALGSLNPELLAKEVTPLKRLDLDAWRRRSR